MRNFFLQIKNIILKQPIAAIFVLILTISFIYQAAWRNQHFQECDSAAPYEFIQNYPQSSWDNINNFNLPGKIFSGAKAEKFLNTSLGSKLGQLLFPNKTLSEKAVLFSTTNPVYLWHKTLFAHVASWKLPYFLRSAFGFGFASTYSFGQGLFYGLITHAGEKYEAFISSSLILTLLLFHLSVLLIFLIALRLGLRSLPAAVAGLWMLFAITMYSQGFHLGSQVWYMFTGALWLYICLKYKDHARFWLIISVTTAVLAWFHYLIVMFWLALVLLEIVKVIRPINWKKLWSLFVSQLLAIASIGFSTLLFFQPGQGKRGNILLASLGGDVYDILGNFFVWYNHRPFFASLQIILGSLVLVIFFVQLYKISIHKNENLELFRKFTLTFIAVYLLFRLANLIGFAPNRQVLFITPLIFVGIAIGLEFIYQKFNWPNKTWLNVCLLLVLAVIGFYAVHLRRPDDRDLSKNLYVDADVQAVVIRDCSYNLKYKTYNRIVPANFFEATNLQAGGTYLYLSQDEAFESVMQRLQEQKAVNYKIISESSTLTNAYFMAYTPGRNRFPWTRPNNLFETKFKIISIKSKLQ